MGNVCSNMEEEYDTELKRGVGNDLVKEVHYNFAAANFRETFYPQIIGQDFWAIATQRRCKEGDENARISYTNMRRYLRKHYASVTEADVDTLYSMIMPIVRRTRVVIEDLKQERINIMTFIRVSYLFYRFADILKDPHMWVFYWADMFYTGYAALMQVQATVAFAYQLDKKDMRYLFRMIQNTEGWIDNEQWVILSDGLSSLGKISGSAQVYTNQAKRAAALKRHREKELAEKEAMEKEIMERGLEQPNNADNQAAAGANTTAQANTCAHGLSATHSNASSTQLVNITSVPGISASEQQESGPILCRFNLDTLNKRALLLAQGVKEAEVSKLLKMQMGTGQTPRTMISARGNRSFDVLHQTSNQQTQDVAWTGSVRSKHSKHSKHSKVVTAEQQTPLLSEKKPTSEAPIVGVARMMLEPIKEQPSTEDTW